MSKRSLGTDSAITNVRQFSDTPKDGKEISSSNVLVHHFQSHRRQHDGSHPHQPDHILVVLAKAANQEINTERIIDHSQAVDQSGE